MQARSSLARMVGADLSVCPGNGVSIRAGADTQVCPYLTLTKRNRRQSVSLIALPAAFFAVTRQRKFNALSFNQDGAR